MKEVPPQTKGGGTSVPPPPIEPGECQHPPRGERLSPSFLLGFRRALYRGAGFSRHGVRRPLIGVVNSWGEISPATRGMKLLTEQVKRGVHDAGGTPVEFVLSGLCDGTCAAAPAVNRFNLPWRDVAASYIEAVATANMFDGLVLVGVCDEVVPAQILAALRLDLPALLVLGGAMAPGVCQLPGVGASRRGVADPVAEATAGEPHEVWAGDMTGGFVAMSRGEWSEEQYLELEDVACVGPGACGVMGTGNTMQVFAEASGLALPGSAVAPGGSDELQELAYQAGRRVLDLLEEGLTPRKVFTNGAVENGVRAIQTVGGSTCAVLHVLAAAAEADLRFELDDFERLGRETPLLVDVRPSGSRSVVDFNAAGGVQAALKALEPLLDLDAVSVTGKTLRQQLLEVQKHDSSLIRSLDDPLADEGGIAVLKGTLAPDGAVFKQSGSAMRRFRGSARVFGSEEEAGEAILAGDVRPGDVIVVRDSGPAGAPGMPCLYGSLWLLKSLGLDDQVALVTDGRLSGTIRGLAVAHVSPESAEGGPLAIVEDGDEIEIDTEERRLDLLVGDRTVAERMSRRPAGLTPPPSGLLRQYRALVGPSHKGAVLGGNGYGGGHQNG